MSPTRAAELTRTMYEIVYTLPQSKKLKRRSLGMDDEQQRLYEVVHSK